MAFGYMYIVDACLYGDAKGVVMTYGSKEITCSFEDISDDPSVCYHVKDKCCQQCRHFYTGIAGLKRFKEYLHFQPKQSLQRKILGQVCYSKI